MPKQKTLEFLNHITKLFVKGSSPAGSRLGSRSFGLDEDVITLIGENVEAFDDAVDELIASFPNMKGTLSKQVFQAKLIPQIRDKKLKGAEFTLQEAEEFEKSICGLSLCKYRVVRQIFGLALSQQPKTIALGDFVIGTGNQLFGSSKDTGILALSIKPEDLEQWYIQCIVEARDTDRAREIADLLFYRFELIFRVLIGLRTDNYEVGILNYVGPRMRNAIVLSDGSVSQNLAWDGALQLIPIDNPYFSSPTPPFPRLFQLISRENTELEKHVVRCAEWTGQALSDANAASAFVKGAIALEVMFSANEKGIITPSIMSQIAESCAFLLGNDATPPWEFEREVKRLYGIRSAVVHSGKDSVDIDDLNLLIQICREVIAKLLTDKDFAETDTMNKLAEYFRRKKYAYASIGNASGYSG
jgi:hypothetical protein